MYDLEALCRVWLGLRKLSNSSTDETQAVRAIELWGELILKLPPNLEGMPLEHPQASCRGILLEDKTPIAIKAALIRSLLPATIMVSQGRERKKLVKNFEDCVQRQLGNIPALGKVFDACLHAISSMALSCVTGADSILAACFRACEGASK